MSRPIGYLLVTCTFLLVSAGMSYAGNSYEPFRSEADKLRITPRYGVGYTPETQISAIGGINGTYRTACDIRIPFSYFDVLAGISTNLSVSASIKGAWYSPYMDTRMEGFRIRYGGRFNYTPKRFYGIGYEAGVQGLYSRFRETSFLIWTIPLFRIARNLYLGPSAGFETVRMSDFTSGGLEEPVERYSSFSAGALLEFDSRDDRIRTQKGILFSLEQRISPAFNYGTGYKTVITADFFLPLWKGSVLAFDIYGHLNGGSSHWITWEQVGDETRMRGYYSGQYRDRNFISAQMELRQDFTPVHGGVVWAGCGNVFPDFGALDISKTLPTVGAGYRLSILGLLLRIDVGFGLAGQWGFTVGMGHAF